MRLLQKRRSIADDAPAQEKSSQIIGLDQLEPGAYQPRRHFDKESIQELAESIAAHGIIQPLVVRPKAGFDKEYEIIAGERRWHAAQIAQLHEVPVVIRKLSDVEALEFGLIENLQREDLNALEEALGYRQLVDEFGHTQEKLAGLGKSRSYVANTMRLLLLPLSVQDYVRDGSLTAGHARALVTVDNVEEVARLIVQKVCLSAMQKSWRQGMARLKPKVSLLVQARLMRRT